MIMQSKKNIKLEISVSVNTSANLTRVGIAVRDGIRIGLINDGAVDSARDVTVHSVKKIDER